MTDKDRIAQLEADNARLGDVLERMGEHFGNQKVGVYFKYTEYVPIDRCLMKEAKEALASSPPGAFVSLPRLEKIEHCNKTEHMQQSEKGIGFESWTSYVCPVCGVEKRDDGLHYADCWLSAAIERARRMK